MSDSTELKKLVKQLQSVTSHKEILDVLDVLKKDFRVTEAILRESKAGLAVGKLRNHQSKSVADAAKDLVKKWKTEVGREKSKPVAQATKTPATPQNTRSAKLDGLNIVEYNDKTRDKCIELIYDALACDSNAHTQRILEKAKIVESSIYDTFGGASQEYKSKIRSLFVNLKGQSNPSLRESVVSGDLDARKLSSMSSADMASEERKAADKKIEEENLFKTYGAAEQQAETDAFQCGRCKQRKCRYRQAQTRSADEPMTTFVTCTVCNNRWKFS